MFEAILRDAFVEHLEKNALITDSQHGFRKGRSCLTNLLTFLEKVTGYVDCGSYVDAIFLDFAKAFDKVPHRWLASKLSHGITGKVYDWIVEWLNGRHQRVCLHCSFSDWLTVLSGVPQGSVSISYDGLKTGKCYSVLTSVKSCISEEQMRVSVII